MNTPRYQSLFIALLMVVLIFSRPFAVLAQQKSVEVQAKMDAKRDASIDFNKPIWPAFGVLRVLSNSSRRNKGMWDFEPTPVEEEIMEMCAYAGIGFLFAVGYAYVVPIYPNPIRFMGKSSEYVDIYTKTYKTKIRELRLISTAIGAVIPPSGCALMILGHD